jgi:hypothetical protein
MKMNACFTRYFTAYYLLFTAKQAGTADKTAIA